MPARNHVGQALVNSKFGKTLFFALTLMCLLFFYLADLQGYNSRLESLWNTDSVKQCFYAYYIATFGKV